jgi:predicted nucleotidyltransferase
LSLARQEAFAEQLAMHVQTDPRVRAVWLEGSLGRGEGDRHSDIDVHIALEPDSADAFRLEYRALLQRLHPVVRYHELFRGSMTGTLLVDETDTIIALQTWLETGDDLHVTAGRIRVLYDRDGRVQIQPSTPSSQEDIARALLVEIDYFWTLFSTLPALERGEVLSTAQRAYEMVYQLIFVHSLGRGRVCDVGDWRLNELLSPAERQRLEAVTRLLNGTPAGIVDTYLELARVMQVAGRSACAAQNVTYPETLERVVLKHVELELQRMGYTELEVTP